MAGDRLPRAARPAARREGPGRRRAACRSPAAARSSATRGRTRTSAWSPTCAGPGRSCWARPTCRNSAPGPTRATPSGAPPATRSTRRARPPGPPAARRWRWPAAWCRSPPARTPAAACATRRRSAACAGSAPRPAWCRARCAAMAGCRWARNGPMARTVPDLAMLLSAMVSRGRARPLARAHRPGHAAPAAAGRPGLPARRADARFRLRAGGARGARGLRGQDRAVPPPVRLRRGCHARLHRGGRGVRGAARGGVPGQPPDRVRTRPGRCRPERDRQRGGGAALLGRRRGAGADVADRDAAALARRSSRRSTC